MRMNDTVAAIVLNYNGFDETKECIESLLAAGFSSTSIYLVDNCSSDRSGEKLKQVFPEVHYDQVGYNSGTGLVIITEYEKQSLTGSHLS